MRILITGGCGFIGSALAKSLIKENHELILVDNLSTGNVQNIKSIKHKCEFYNLDLSYPASIRVMDDLLTGIDVVYHLAASIGVKLVQEKPQQTFRNSTQINQNLFPLFEKHNVKVIYSSTSEVYGETKNSTGSSEDDKLEISPVQKPRSSYACSKLFSEFLLKSYSFPNVIVRFFNIVGPSQVGDFGHVLPKFISSALNNEDLKVYHDGTQVRSFCDIRDCVEMLKLLLDDIHDSEIYNIGSDENVCNISTLAATVIKLTNSKSRIINIELKEAFGDKFEEIFIRFPNTNKIKKYYKCKYNLEDIIQNIL